MEKKNKIKFDVKTAQINAQRKNERRNTIYAWILLVLFVFWTIGSVLAFVNTFAGCSMYSTGYISAKADEGVAETALTGDEMNGTINDFDITNYPSANYFNIENYKGDNGGWITVSNGVVNSIVVVASESTVYGVPLSTTLAEFCPELLVGETYTLSFELSSDLARNAIRLNSSGNSAGVYWYNGQSRTIDASDLSSPIYLYPLQLPGVMPDGKCVYSSIMINKGTEVMPYFPYFKSLYNAGYNDAMAVSSYGFLVGSTVSATATYNYAEYGSSIDEIVLEEHIPVNYSADLVLSNGGFDLSQVYTYFENNKPIIPPEGTPYFYSWTDFSLKLRFGQPLMVDYFENNYYFRNYGNFFVTYSSMLICENFDGSGNVYRAGLSVTPNQGEGTDYNPQANTFKITTTSLPSSITNISDYYVLGIDISSSSSLMPTAALNSYSFYAKDGLFAYGYNQGFNDGMVSGQSFKDGYNKGFSEGERNGYDKGFNAGNTVGYTDGFGAGKIEGAATANDYSFMSLISATIDAPIQAFTKMFDFDILGVNLTNFFLSLLSVGIVLVVLKLIFGGA